MSIHTLITQVHVQEDALAEPGLRAALLGELTEAARRDQRRLCGARWPIIARELRDMPGTRMEAWVQNLHTLAIKTRVWRPRQKVQLLRWHGPDGG